MDYTNIGTAPVEQGLSEQSGTQLRELNDLQLALVAGGVGEVTFN